MLKKTQKQHDFPHYDQFTSTDELKRILREVKRETILDENVNHSKQILTMVWWGLEKLGTEYLSIDLSGFTAHEAQNMGDYHKALVELGERSYLNWSEGAPPEVKLLYIIITHAAVFHIMKDTSKSISDVMNLFGKEPEKKTGSMKGPTQMFF